MDWTNKNVDPKKVVQLGEEVEVMVLEIDEERRRISLGMKQCKPNPWEEFAATHQKGDTVKGQIKSITDFGVSSVLKAVSTVSFTSPTCPGQNLVKKLFASTRRAKNSKQLFSLSTSNVNVSPSVLSR